MMQGYIHRAIADLSTELQNKDNVAMQFEPEDDDGAASRSGRLSIKHSHSRFERILGIWGRYRVDACC